MLFGRLQEKDERDIRRKLGEYVSHKVVAPTGWGRNHLRSVAELNSLDRHELARDWYSRQFENEWVIAWITRVLAAYNNDVDWLIEDVAAYIDDRIPRAYEKHYEQNADKGPAQYYISASRSWTGNLRHGLRYCYRRQYIPNRPKPVPVSVDEPLVERIPFHDQLAERVKRKLEAEAAGKKD